MFNFKFIKLFLIFCFGSWAVIFANAQSSDQNFPTPITSNEISGTIKARAVGDPRLTTYFFTFNGGQGDIFINVVTRNLNGDIDIFAVEGLRPLTKIVIYADSTENETGRVIYLRKPEKILMRIQGRSPDDDPATFQIKFAGSFVASSDKETDAPKLPEIKRENESGVIVNSVGTIIGIKPKPTPEPREIVVEKKDESEKINKETAKTGEENTEKEIIDQNNEPQKTETPKVIITDELEKKDESKLDEAAVKNDEETEENAEQSVENNDLKIPENKDENETAEKEKPKKVKEKSKKEKELEALENIRLVVLLKDGGKIERPMSEILKFGVEKGTLTIINKDGSISRYSILDVESVTIQ